MQVILLHLLICSNWHRSPPHGVLCSLSAKDQHQFHHGWTWGMIVAIITNAVLLPYILCFSGQPPLSIVIIFTAIDALFMANLGFTIARKQAKPDVYNQGDPLRMQRYLRGMFWYDLLACFPLCWARALIGWDVLRVWDPAWRLNTLLMVVYWPKYWKVCLKGR